MTAVLLQLLLRLAPREFRERYGPEVLDVHDARRPERPSIRRRMAFAVREVGGLAWTIVKLRLGRARPRRHRKTAQGGGGTMMEGMRQDIRFAIRTLRRNPGFTFTAAAVLALGIGANTAIFSAANAYLFRPLPFGDADRLVMLYETNPEFGWVHETAAPANVLDWRDQVDAFSDVAVYSEFRNEATHIRDGEPELLSFAQVSGNFFSVLGVPMELGSGFRWEQTWSGADNVVVLSHDFWVSHFGADPDVVGTTLDLAGASPEIVGVAPAGMRFPSGIQFWTPWGWDPANRQAVWFRRAHWVRPIARLAPGVTPSQADAAFQTVVQRLQTDFPETNRVMGAGMMPLRTFLTMEVRGPLSVLMGAVVLLLLLACTNVANLMLVRASDRTREVALRFALGAGRGRVARQMLTEGLLLASVGGVVGLGLGWLGIQLLASKRAMGIEGATTLTLDWRVVAFTAATAILSGLVFGAAPAWRTAAGRVHDALKDGGRGGSAGRTGTRTVSTLVAVEVALAVLIVVGAGLMVRSFWLLRSVDPGFRTSGVLALEFGIPSARYENRDQVLAFQDDFERRLEGRPGIEGAGAVSQLPLAGASWSSQFQAEGWPPDRVGFEILHRQVDPGYFKALDVPLIRGRLFGPDDGPESPLVVVVNEAFVRQHFPGEDPIGQRIAYDRQATPESTWHEIVGIVGDQAQENPSEPPRAEVFESRRQDWSRTMWYVVRTDGPSDNAIPTVRAVLHEIDPLIPIAEMKRIHDVWRASMADEEFLLTLMGAFGAMALLLASVGIYGVTAQAARKRTQEIGIRMALGAGGRQVLRMILMQGMLVVVVGLVVGLGGALLAAGTLGALLYGIAPTDPPTLAAVVALLGAVAALACYVPARRATTVDPAISLRRE